MSGTVAQWQVRCFAFGGSQVQIPLQPPRMDLGQVLHSQLPVALRHVNSDAVPVAVVGALLKADAVRSAIEMDKCNTIQCPKFIDLLNSSIYGPHIMHPGHVFMV